MTIERIGLWDKWIRLALIVGSVVYTFLFGILFGTEFVFRFLLLFSPTGTVSGSAMNFVTGVFVAILVVDIFIITFLLYTHIKKSLWWMYVTSLATSFLIPVLLNFGFIPNYLNTLSALIGLVVLVLNALFGPAMLILLSYFVVGLVKSGRT